MHARKQDSTAGYNLPGSDGTVIARLTPPAVVRSDGRYMMCGGTPTCEPIPVLTKPAFRGWVARMGACVAREYASSAGGPPCWCRIRSSLTAVPCRPGFLTELDATQQGPALAPLSKLEDSLLSVDVNGASRAECLSALRNIGVAEPGTELARLLTLARQRARDAAEYVTRQHPGALPMAVWRRPSTPGWQRECSLWRVLCPSPSICLPDGRGTSRHPSVACRLEHSTVPQHTHQSFS